MHGGGNYQRTRSVRSITKHFLFWTFVWKMKEPNFESEEVILVVGRIISELDQWKNITKQIFSKLCVENGWGPFIYYVSTCRGEGGVRKCQFLLILSTKNMLEGGPKIPKMWCCNIWMVPCAKFWVRRGHWQLLVVGRIISELDQWNNITKQKFSKLCVENEGAKFWVRKGHWQFLVVGSIISELDQWSNCFPNFWKMKEPEKVNDS